MEHLTREELRAQVNELQGELEMLELPRETKKLLELNNKVLALYRILYPPEEKMALMWVNRD